MVGEWIPFGSNQIVALNERLGALDRCQGGLFTAMVDKVRVGIATFCCAKVFRVRRQSVASSCITFRGTMAVSVRVHLYERTFCLLRAHCCSRPQILSSTSPLGSPV